MSTHGLASITATYTDSEPEGEEDDSTLQDDKRKSASDDDADSDKDKLGVEALHANFRVPESTRHRVAKLVSYHDDTIISDEETDLITTTGTQDPVPTNNRPLDDDDVEIPPEPSGNVSPRVKEKVAQLYAKIESGLDMNEIIQNRKSFRNPSIYEKLITFCKINELGTNYPERIYDPLKWGKESFYEELARVQKVEMEKREKEKKERTKVEFVSGTKKGGGSVEEETKKRKSKWDQVGANSANVPGTGVMAAIRPAGLVQPSLTTSVTGTKGTVISAFGSLPKKPKV